MGNPLLWIGSTAITAVRNTIQDPSGAASQRWTDAEIIGYLDRAVSQIVADTETAIESSWEAKLVESQREYSLHPNFFKDKVVEWHKATDDVRRLTYLPREEFEELYARDPTQEGEPTHYWFWSRKGDDPVLYQTGCIFLYPAPDAAAADSLGPAADDYNLTIWGYKIPDAIEATKTIELESPYIEAMLQFASALAKMDDGDLGSYDRMMGNYYRMVGKIQDIRAQKSRSRYSQIRARDSVVTPFSTDLPWRRPWVG